MFTQRCSSAASDAYKRHSVRTGEPQDRAQRVCGKVQSVVNKNSPERLFTAFQGSFAIQKSGNIGVTGQIVAVVKGLGGASIFDCNGKSARVKLIE